MAQTLSAIGRARRANLRDLSKASRALDARQEILEREVKRLQVRRSKVPELADAQRLAAMAGQVSQALSSMISVIESVAQAWTQF